MDETKPAENGLAFVLERLLKIGFGLGGVLSLATGIWMLAAPVAWFELFPGGIPDTGALNAHLVRDLGGWLMAGGVLFLFALTNPHRFGGVTLIVALVTFLSHASVHVSDLTSGRLPTEHWVVDVPVVFAPVLLLAVLLWVWWKLESELHPESHRAVEEPKEPALFVE